VVGKQYAYKGAGTHECAVTHMAGVPVMPICVMSTAIIAT
jgi:hypothetical protein